MIKRYTFLKHPFYYLLENSGSMVAGLEKCVAVFYDNTSSGIEVLSYNGGFTSVLYEDLNFIKQLRESKKQVNWIKENQVGFELNVSEVEQLSFKDEQESSVLEMRFPNPYDGGFDVLYFYFKNNIGNFKLSKSDEVMAITIKEVIQNILYKQVSLIIDSSLNNSIIHEKISNTLNDNTLQKKIDQLEVEMFEIAKSNYSHLLDRVAEGEKIEFVLSNAAVKKIAQQNLSLHDAELVLLNSLEVLLNKINPKKFYEITSSDLVFSLKGFRPSVTTKQEGLNKTMLYLDKYEAAAKVIVSKGKRVTGFNIGENCYPKVSPAAISDILKKHQKKITVLFQQYPEKWSTVRSRFKPIVKISERNSSENQYRFGA
jgi:hypothetical protein